MVRIDRHREALPLYHGNYYGRLKKLRACLQRLPGLHLEANYRGGVSVRDRIVCAQLTAHRIADELTQSVVSEKTYSLYQAATRQYR